MPWNEPGDSNNKKDPWTGRSKQTPPDLESLLREIAKKILALFKLKTKLNILNKVKKRSKTKSLSIQFRSKWLGLTFGLLILFWINNGFFVVDADQQAVITRFGKFVTLLPAGRHWIFKPFEQQTFVYKSAQTLSWSSTLLTKDQNSINAKVELNYQIISPRQYLFASVQPLQILHESIANALQETLNSYTLQELVKMNPIHLQEQIKQKVIVLLKSYSIGLIVNDVELTPIQIPQNLKAAFDALAQANLKKEQLEKQAETDAMQLQPSIEVQTKKILADAQNYRQKVLLHAKAETARFLALLPIYEAAPELTCKRLYQQIMNALLQQSHTIFIDKAVTNPIKLTLGNINASNEATSKNLSKTVTNPSQNNYSELPITPLADHLNADIPSNYEMTEGYE